MIAEVMEAEPRVLGFHDLMVHDYGPGQRFGSLHVEMDQKQDALLCHELIDDLERNCLQQLGVHLVIHYDPVAVGDRHTDEVRSRIETLVRCIDESISIHDFRLVPEGDTVCVVFDAAVPFHFRLTDRQVEERIVTAVQALDNTCRVVVRVERPFT